MMNDLKAEAVSLFLATLEDIDIEKAIYDKVKVIGNVLTVNDDEINLDGYGEILLIGFGKASIKMGAAVEHLLEHKIKKGILVTDRQPRLKVKSEVIVGGHPLPNEGSLRAGQRIIEAVEACDERCLIIFLVSGGGSSLVESPLSPDIKLEDLQKLNRVLVNCGASIREINVIRKRLSRIKGGKLGSLARKARCVSIFISDVNRGDLRSIASNPLLSEDTTIEDFFKVIDQYKLMEKFPPSVRGIIESGAVCESIDNTRADQANLTTLLLLDNSDAILAAAKRAKARGYRVVVDFDHVEGYYRQVADSLINHLLTLCREHPGESICLISGGEVACPVHGEGVGGRNQEFVLYSAAALEQVDNEMLVAVLSCGTDGIDGNSNAAGAVAGPDTIIEARQRGLFISDYFDRNDSHSFFKEVGGVVVTGATGNNIRDLRIFLAHAK